SHTWWRCRKIARQSAKSSSDPPLPPAPAALEGTVAPRGRIVEELSALALIGLVAFATVSLACLDLGRAPNLGGPVGEKLASALGAVLGYQAYAGLGLLVVLAVRVWTRTPLLTLTREALGGAIVLAALATAGGLFDPTGSRIGGLAGAL